MFSFVDVGILLILVAWALYGFFVGFIRAAGSLSGALVGIWCAVHYQHVFGDAVGYRVLAFILIYAVVSRGIAFIAYLMDKLFIVVKFIPFAGLVNKSLGALLAIAEATVVLLGVYFVLLQFTVTKAWIDSTLAQSALLSLIKTVAEKVLAFAGLPVT